MAFMLWRVFFRKKYVASIKQTPFLNLKRAARALLYAFNIHTLVMLALSWIAVYICAELDIRSNMDFTMISTGTVFPLTFTLSQAFTRRERATALLASIKASAVALYWMHRDWDQSQNYPASLGNDGCVLARRAKALLLELLTNIRKYLVTHTSYESLAEARLTASKNEFLSLLQHEFNLNEKDRTFRSAVKQLIEEGGAMKHLKSCYTSLSKLSVLNEKLTVAAGYTRGGEGGLSRTNQYLRYIIANLEELRTIKEYRTPTMMRHACSALVHVFAIALSPYFVHYCTEDDVCFGAFASSAAYVLITMLLLHVQQDLEYCMDESGLDDAFITLAEEVDEISGEPIIHSERTSYTDGLAGSSPLFPAASMELSNFMGVPVHHGRSTKDSHTLSTIPDDEAPADPGASIAVGEPGKQRRSSADSLPIGSSTANGSPSNAS